MSSLVAEHNKVFTVALAGNPNSGKTTLFNALTGMQQKVANFPGVTVEKKLGRLMFGETECRMIDLPGTYSLAPRSEDARIAAEIILGRRKDVTQPNLVLCVVDSNCLERSLSLVTEVLETRVPAVVLLNMTDELERIGMSIDTEGLEAQLGVPVLAIAARNGEGIAQVKQVIQSALANRSAPVGDSSQTEQDDLGHKPLGHELIPEECPRRMYPGLKFKLETVEERRRFVKTIAQSVIQNTASIHSLSDKLDRVVMHKVTGPVIFAAVVLLVFQAVFSWATPLMDLIDAGFSTLADLVFRIGGQTVLTSLMADGIIAGVGGVLVFLPQILIVFLFVALMENSGYLARSAIVMDRFFRLVGLQGKSFLPFISSYACAVPGIMATRVIENRRERLATMFVAPFMTCSARLPVYALLIAAFIPNKSLIPGLLGLRSLTMILLYLVGFLAAMLTAVVMGSSRVMKKELTPFRIEIPPYRWPSLRSILMMMWQRSKIFLRKAGTVILAVNLILWALASFPRTQGEVVLENTWAGRIGKTIEPVIKPLGFNWQIGVGLVASQAAREVMVSTLSTIYSIDEQADESLQAAVKSNISPLAGVSLMVFFALAMQCMSTTAIVRRETGGWRIPIIQFFYMNTLAYLASLCVFQIGSLLA